MQILLRNNTHKIPFRVRCWPWDISARYIGRVGELVRAALIAKKIDQHFAAPLAWDYPLTEHVYFVTNAHLRRKVTPATILAVREPAAKSTPKHPFRLAHKASGSHLGEAYRATELLSYAGRASIPAACTIALHDIAVAVPISPPYEAMLYGNVLLSASDRHNCDARTGPEGAALNSVNPGTWPDDLHAPRSLSPRTHPPRNDCNAATGFLDTKFDVLGSN